MWCEPGKRNKITLEPDSCRFGVLFFFSIRCFLILENNLNGSQHYEDRWQRGGAERFPGWPCHGDKGQFMAVILTPSLLPNRRQLMIRSELIWTEWKREKVSCPFQLSQPGVALSSPPVGGWWVASKPVAWRISALEQRGGARTSRESLTQCVGAARAPAAPGHPLGPLMKVRDTLWGLTPAGVLGASREK